MDERDTRPGKAPEATLRAVGSFALPAHLEAAEPAEVRGQGRDDVRLLVTHGADGAPAHARFPDLPDLLEPGDLVVFNASATLPSSVQAKAEDGTRFRISISTRLPGGICIVEPRERTPQPGETVYLDGNARLVFHARFRDSKRLWTAQVFCSDDFVDFLYRYGSPVAYRHTRTAWPIETYQNVFASEAGSAEMPSAGRPFTREILDRMRARGIETAFIVLHAGVSSPEHDEPPYEEQFRVPVQTASLIEKTRAAGGRVVAVGTTVVRALETATDRRGKTKPANGWTDLIITPARGMRAVDALLTGFHEPRSSHLAMLETLAGPQHIIAAYREALERGYLWHEFGDSHLIVPGSLTERFSQAVA